MNDVYKLLEQIQERPLSILLEKSLQFLFQYLRGYLRGVYKYNPEAVEFFNEFQKYVQNHYRVTYSPASWDFMISERSKDQDEAFKIFFKLINDYIVETTGKNLEENANLE
ncbi:hypothetical protein A4V34_05350 [Listeria monocytogenes]|nr:hypothetical protein [Listeria monocytogenes]EIO5735576.1 hypothetical protein [Listeria monocytogenes]